MASRTRLFEVLLSFVLFGIPTPRCFADDEDTRRFAALVETGLALSSRPESRAQEFFIDFRIRGDGPDGRLLYGRINAERSGPRVAAMLLSPSGIPSSILLDNLFIVVDDGKAKVLRGSHFRCDAGTKGRSLGIELDYSTDVSQNSELEIDLSKFLREPLSVPDSRFEYDERYSRYRISSPRGTEALLYLDRYAIPGAFPIRALVVSGSTPTGGRLEMAFSVLSVGEAPPRSLFAAVQAISLVPIVPASLDEIRSSHLQNFGRSVDETDPAARAVALKLLRGLKTHRHLAIEDQTLARIATVLDFSNQSTDTRAEATLGQLRAFGSKHIWGPLQEGHTVSDVLRGRGFRLDYDRFKAAAYTEIALGPEVTPMLYETLYAVATSQRLGVAARCEALDLLGRFGLPPLSKVLDRIDAAFADEARDELHATLASVRVRQAVGTDEDVERLHRTVREQRLAAQVLVTAVEALAMIDELGPHGDHLATLWTEHVRSANGDSADGDRTPGPLFPRLLRALAATEVGRALLLREIETDRDGRPWAPVFSALAEASSPKAPDRPRLVQLARATALNEQKPNKERYAANRVLLFDPETMASDYPEAFFRSALKTNDTTLLLGSMWNMAKLGRGDECFDALHDKLSRSHAADRLELATVVTTIMAVQLELGQGVPESFWNCQELLLRDGEPKLLRLGVTNAVYLLEAGKSLPTKLIPLIAEAGVAASDPQDLALACVTLQRLTTSQYTPPFPVGLNSTTQVFQWTAQNAHLVRDHLRQWLATQTKTGNRTVP